MGVSLNRPIIREFELEFERTREILSRLPDDQMHWRPHERSMTLGRLGSHIAEMPRYGRRVLETDRLDSTVRKRGPVDLDRSAAILEVLGEESRRFLEALGRASDEDLLGRWSYCKGEQVLFEVLRLNALRGFVLNHLYHHRGQLTVYLRLLDVPVPQIYGPTADDRGAY